MSGRRALSLRARLLAGMAFVAVVLTVASVVITISTREGLIDQVDRRLEHINPQRDGGPDDGGPDDGGPDDGGPDDGDGPGPPPSDGSRERISDVYEGVVEADGTLVTQFMPNVGDDFTAPALDPADLPVDGVKLLTARSEDGEHTYRVRAEAERDEVFITALPLDDVSATIARLVLIEVTAGLAILAALGVVSWWVLHLGIRPVEKMTATAARIADGDLDVRIPSGAPGTESGALAGALNRMLDERAESEARMRHFVSDASHELRTPVTTIRGYAELYRHGGLADPSALDDAMLRTEQEAARMGRLVDDLLLLAKLDEQRPLDDRDVDVGALVRDAAGDARVAAPGRRIDVDVDVDVKGARLVVRGDEDRLRQVLANVVGNALVHTAPDVPVRLSARHEGNQIVVDVTDRGPGMSPDVARRVTERFFRADPSRARHRGGSGLGLSIVDAITRAHGGTVAVTSTPGEGTTVRLFLPAAGDA